MKELTIDNIILYTNGIEKVKLYSGVKVDYYWS